MRLCTALAMLFLLAASTALCREPHGSPDDAFYRSTDGQLVHRPTRAADPADGKVTATCRDGSLSYSHHHRGTCFGHGGVRDLEVTSGPRTTILAGRVSG